MMKKTPALIDATTPMKLRTYSVLAEKRTRPLPLPRASVIKAKASTTKLRIHKNMQTIATRTAAEAAFVSSESRPQVVEVMVAW
jgi:hypothetical protein